MSGLNGLLRMLKILVISMLMPMVSLLTQDCYSFRGDTVLSSPTNMANHMVNFCAKPVDFIIDDTDTNMMKYIDDTFKRRHREAKQYAYQDAMHHHHSSCLVGLI